ncbi:ABC1 kinase family protein [Mastigocoleus testarum]|uniref:ABC transporter n=1 Tax=Mastigocoleus testarum BC008 TaxID=371196 RepID=A0A0V7ZJM4_9CYAN|nr:AarF/ABC1/UbiB kinase family protein [Mastigocoleus testarum]KST63472.1 ABC transporter [Mastigocoleus testarum BC008]KST64604.1 ABC transporter [Mastigocoleus testarum BC008]
MFITQTVPRQREIIEVLLRNGWDYMRRLLTGGKADRPQLPTPAVLKNILVDLGPVYIKLGQLLSTRPDLLSGAYIDELSTLQDEVPPVPWSEVEIIIRKQLNKPLSEIFSTINPIPVAAGSIAQTHRATLANGREVALKVQRPGIDITVSRDIALIEGIADLVSRTDFGQIYEIKTIADEFCKALEDELDFTREAGFTDKLRSNLSQSKWFDPQKLVVAEIDWELTTPKLLVMEWLDGGPILSADLGNHKNGKDPTTERKEITSLLFRAFSQQLYIDGFFHADPHPGNIFYLKDGRVALLDCGMVGRLDPRTQQILIEMLLAIVDLDAQRCAQLTLQLSDVSQKVNLSRLEADYDRLLRKYFNLSLSQLNFSEVVYEIFQVARNNRIRLPSNMGLYAKTIANLEGLARSFNPELNFLDEIKPLITDLFRQQLFGDAPVRSLLRTALDLKSLSLQSPRQLELVLERVTSETLQWNLSLKGLDNLRRTADDAANRLSFSILVGSLIMGAAIVSSNAKTNQLSIISNVLFATASLLSIWLIISILRSGRLR